MEIMKIYTMIQEIINILDKYDKEDYKILIEIIIEYYKFNYEEDI